MALWVIGLRRSGTTILYDALGEDPSLRRFYEPLREEAETIGGGSGARDVDVFAETRGLRERFRADRYPELPSDDFNWGGPRAPELELEPELPAHASDFLAHLLAQAPEVAIKETRLHHKLGAIAGLDPDAVVVHLVRDPRAVTASMLLGRRRRTDIYPDADAFFSKRTKRALWSSRGISEALLAGQTADPAAPGGEAEEAGGTFDIPDFVRPMLVWKAAFEAAEADGHRHFGERFALVRLEDLRADPATELDRIYALLGRETPAAVVDWARENVQAAGPVHHGDDPRWARGARAVGMMDAIDRAGYGEVGELEPPGEELDLSPPPKRSRLAGLVGRGRRRA